MHKEKKLSHLDESGNANMVDVSNKPISSRKAEASCKILLNEISFKLVKENKANKGDVLGVARVAGIMAAKKTAEIIPLCHQLNLSKVEINFTLTDSDKSIIVTASASTFDRTGIEMESLVGASVASLTVYDMLKSVDKEIRITDLVLNYKAGGKSGTFVKGKRKTNKL